MTRIRGSTATPGQSIVIGVILGLIGLVILGFAARLSLQELQFVLGSRTASGTVVDLKPSGSVYDPVIRFTTADGRQVTFTDPQGSNPPSNKVGETVQVIYPAGAPQEARLNSFLDFWLSPLALTVFGAFFLISGIGGIYGGIQRRRASNPTA